MRTLRRTATRTRGLLPDLRHSARALLRRPGFSLLTVATLAAGIGAAISIVSLAEALVLRPLPLEHDDRLVRLFTTNARLGRERSSVSYPDFDDLTRTSGLFEASSLYAPRARDVSGGADPERILTSEVHEGFFQTLGTPAHLGRVFAADDHDPARGPSAVLARTFWERRYAGDPALIGATIRLDGVPHTVIGVIDDAVGWPAGVDVWTPLAWGRAAPEAVAQRSNHAWQVVARLRPDVELATARARVAEMATAIYARPEVDPRDAGSSAVLVPLRSSETGAGTGALFATLGAAVFLVLLIACMNASGLLLVRAASRRRELSLRAALGAGRLRLGLVLVGESLALAAAGGALGVGLGVLALRYAFAQAPPSVTVLGDPRLNPTVVLAGLGITLFAAMVAGLVPALRASRVSVSESLKEAAGATGGDARSSRLRRSLVVAEIAFTLALVVSAALAVRGFQRQLATDPGFEADGLLSFTVRLPADRYGQRQVVDAFYDEAVERLARHPGITSATATSRLPLGAGGLSLTRSFVFEDDPAPPEGAGHSAAWVEVDPDYFGTLGVAPREGRAFTADDGGDAPPVAIVNERMARIMAPDGSIVGRSIRSHYDENLPRMVIGVVPDFQLNGVSRAARMPLVLVPRAQSPRTSMAFLVRTSGEPTAILAVVRRTMSELDADVALDGLQTLRDAHAADLAGIRFLTNLFAAFGTLALVMAVSGVYGLVSTTVTQRTRELGVRMAMGATATQVRGAVLGESAALAGVGLAMGCVLAYGAGRVLAAGMDGVAVPEASTYVAGTAALALAVLAASWFPARRATRVDPGRGTEE